MAHQFSLPASLHPFFLLFSAAVSWKKGQLFLAGQSASVKIDSSGRADAKVWKTRSRYDPVQVTPAWGRDPPPLVHSSRPVSALWRNLKQLRVVELFPGSS